MFDIAGALGRLLGRHKPEAQAQPMQTIATPAALQHIQQPLQQRTEPDITVDPTGRIPYSAKTPELAQMGNRYTENPTSPEFIGVDPAQFGYPADDTSTWSNLRRNILGR